MKAEKLYKQSKFLRSQNSNFHRNEYKKFSAAVIFGLFVLWQPGKDDFDNEVMLLRYPEGKPSAFHRR